MPLSLAARKPVADRPRRRACEPMMTFTGGRAGSRRHRPRAIRRTPAGPPEIAIDGAEERILALLVTVYGKAARPGILDTIRRAARYWQQGEDDLAAIELRLAACRHCRINSKRPPACLSARRCWRRA